MNHPRGTLVGRERELAALEAAFAHAGRGNGSVALIRGEPGIGKTRLLEAASARASELGFAVAWGRAWELGSAPVYWPFIEALRALFERPEGRDEIAAHLCRLLPELDPRSACGAAPRLANADTFQLCDLVRGYLEAAAAREPVLLVLDDLHAADASSLALAEFVARRAGGMRLVLLASHRDVEARRTPEQEAAFARLSRTGRALAPARLGLPEVERLVLAELGAAPRETVQLIHRTSEGNPLFVHELVRLVQARGAGSSAASGAGSSAVPAGIRAVIRERLSLLMPATVALLQAAAVVGREFDVSLAAEVAGVTPAALREAAEEAERAELIEPAGTGRLRFSHALVAETLASEPPAAQRARLHLRTAEALERRHAGDVAAPLDQIAHHLLEAGDDVRPRATVAAELAARAAGARLAFADATALCRRALAALALLSAADPARRAELGVLLAESAARAGDRKAAAEACRSATEIAQSLGDGVLFTRAALALGAEVTVGRRDPEVAELLTRALALLPEGDGPWRAQALARLASARQPEPDPAVPMQLGRDAIAMARRLGERDVLLRVLHSAMGALVDYAPPAERAALNREAAELAEACGDRARALRARLRLVFDHAEEGDPAAFESALFAYERLADEVRQPRHQAPALLLRAMRAEWEGRFTDADRLEHEARQLEADSPEPIAPLREIAKAFLREEPARFSQVLEQTRRFYADEDALMTGIRALERSKLGDLDEARRLARKLEPQLAVVLADIHGTALFAELVWALRDRELARHVHRALVPYRGRFQVVTGIGYALYGLVDHALLRMSALLGLREEAEQHAARSLAAMERLRAAPLIAALQRDHAIALTLLDTALGNDEAASAARIAQLLEAAAAAYEQIGMVRAAADCRSLLAAPRLQPAAPAAVPAASAPVACALEGEHWVVSGLGQLCRVRDGRGMRMLAQLIESPGRELHVLDLSGALDAVDGGDAGELIDKSARAAYERRLRDLETELQEASDWNDSARRERLEAEAEALRAELSRALGLGGRERRSGSATERARVNVRRRLALALRRIEEVNAALGAHLTASVRTGIYCAYEPRD